MSDAPRGPAMIAATNMLRPPPARIGKISDKIVLPRSVELKKVVAGGLGAFAFVLLWLFPIGLIFGYGLQSFFLTAAAGAAVGVLVVTVSPLRGESMSRWLGLMVSSRRAERVTINGRTVRAYIGVAPLGFTAGGVTHVRAGAVDVPAGAHDDRGVPVSTHKVRRDKLDAIGNRVAAPAAHEGFSEITSLDSAPAGANFRNAVQHSSFMPGQPTAPQPPAGPWPQPSAAAAPQPQAGPVPAPQQWDDPFAGPAARLPRA